MIAWLSLIKITIFLYAGYSNPSKPYYTMNHSTIEIDVLVTAKSS